MEDSKKFLIYETENSQIIADVLIMNDTIWMTQKQMSCLFDVGVPAISKHLNNIFAEAELDKEVVISKMETNIKTFVYYIDKYFYICYNIYCQEGSI